MRCGLRPSAYNGRACLPLTRADVVFFSSRRRHTRCLSDWSSDVCSSDLMIRHHRDLNSSHLGISYAVFCLRSEEHPSELQSLRHLVCRLLLEKKQHHQRSKFTLCVAVNG